MMLPGLKRLAFMCTSWNLKAIRSGAYRSPGCNARIMLDRKLTPFKGETTDLRLCCVSKENYYAVACQPDYAIG